MRTTYASDKILNLYRGTTFTAPAAVYAGLLTAVTDHEAGTVTETAYGAYARQAITFAAPGASLGGRQTLAGAMTLPSTTTSSASIRAYTDVSTSSALRRTPSAPRVSESSS